MKLSVALIVKNESGILAGCLESVKNADEIVVVDTGSEDNTIEIAKRYTDKVFTDYKWEDHFANARNHAISKCSGDWILSIDADDILAEGGIQSLRETIKKYPEQLCFNIQFVAEKGNATHKIPYIYKNCKEVFFKGAAHNYLSIPATIDAGTSILYGYSPSHKKDPDRTFRILKKVVQEDHTKVRELFYLSREYQYRENWEECLYWADEYLKIAYWSPEIADAYLRKARCYWQLQRGEEARDACLQAIKINTHFREALLFMAEMSGPINRETWLFMAELANNSNVLFVRNRIEKPSSYYESINDSEPRYDELYKEVGQIVGARSILDIGCGSGELSKHIKNYAGFDMIPNPYRVADIYTHAFGDYDVYILLEVLEHLTNDLKVLQKIPENKNIIFSVPSFDCPSHVRMFTENIIRWRYENIIELSKITRFNFDSINRKWKINHPPTPSYILLCEGWRV